jgi:hypothetical protein
MSHHALFHNLLDSGIFKDKLVAYYSFENNANDIHSTKNGTLIGTPTFSTGKNNLGIDFGNNADDNGVEIADNNDFSFVNDANTADVPFSISFWVRLSAYSPTFNALISKRLSSVGTAEYQLSYATSIERFSFVLFDDNTTGLIGVRSDFKPNLNQWYHAVLTYNGSALVSGLKMYIDNNLQTASVTSGTYTKMINSTTIVRIGSSGVEGPAGGKHRGMIDEAAIWKDRELTGAEVAQLYNAGAGKFYDTF